jgi:biopolymer transport protein ExbD
MSPMIDLVFLLLIFFMTSSTIITYLKDKSVSLPVAADARVPKLITPRVVVNVYPDGALADERGRALNESTLRAYLQAATAKEPDVRLLVRPDRSVAHASVQTLLQEARKAGIHDVIFATYTSEL